MQDITILGHRGNYLSLIFENLTSIKFKGKINIIINESGKRFNAPFETDIPYQEWFYKELKMPPQNRFVFCSNKPSTKKFLLKFYQKYWGIKAHDFINLIHQSAVISSTVEIGQGLQLEPLSVISPYAKIGFGVNISRNCSIGHHNVLGDFCSINLGANMAGEAEIGVGVTIGPGCTVFAGVKIGKNTIIGGGSVVTKDMPSNVLAYGNPCKVVKRLEVS